MPYISDDHSSDFVYRINNHEARSAKRRTRGALYWRNQIESRSIDLRRFARVEQERKQIPAVTRVKRILPETLTQISSTSEATQQPKQTNQIISGNYGLQKNREAVLRTFEEIEEQHLALKRAIGGADAAAHRVESEYAPWTYLPQTPVYAPEIQAASDNREALYRAEEEFSRLALFAPPSSSPGLLRRSAAVQRHELIPDIGNAAVYPAKKKRGITSGLIGCAIVFVFFLLGGVIWQRSQGLESRVAPEVLQAYGSLEQAKADLTSLRFAQASSEFSLAEEKFSDAENLTDGVGGALLAHAVAASPVPNKARSGLHLIAAGVEFSRAGADVSHAAFLLSSSRQGPTQSSFAPVFSEAMREFSDAQSNIVSAQNDLAYVRIEDIPQAYQAQFSDSLARLNDANSIFQSMGQLSDALTTLAGMQNEKTYLLLFQNPAEIRATGGFLGTYGIVKVEQGQIKSIKADGTYDADGQLAVNVVPPYPVEYISTGWSMHDANWFFDFPTSAEKVIWFYEKTGGETPDGVIAITPRLVENILNMTGPIPMPAYNVTLTSDNFEDVVQQQVEVNYDKTQNKPKQILSDFMPLLFARAQDALSSHPADFAHLLMRSLQQKDVFLYSRDQNVERLVDEQGWSGRVSPPASQGVQDVQDVLGVVQTNLGGYKTDRVIRTIVQTNTAAQADGSIHRVVTVTRTHQGGKSIYDWYNKPNIDYMRIYVPEGSKLLQASGFSAQPVIPSFDYRANNFATDETVASTGLGAEKDPASNTDIFKENGMEVFGNWLILKPGETKTVQFEYVLPSSLNTPSSYTLSLFSQAGVEPVLGVSFDASQAGRIATCSQGSYNAQSVSFQKAAFSTDTKVTCVVGR